ncbi:MAG: FG-GAP repeat domain-containing protein [Akkermansiaceae bacterium]
MASLRILFFFMLVGLVRAEQGMREEQLAARAGAFWKEWAHVWDGSVTDEEMSPQLSQGAVFHRDQAEVLNQRLEGAFQVNDRKVGGRAAEGRKAVLEAFRNWPLTWSEGPVERSKFKVVGVEVDEGELTTTELVAVITGGATVREYNGVWQTRWEIKGDTLLFKESNIQDGKVVSATGGTLFSERTSGLLPADCDGDLELVEENFYWRERVPASFEPDQFGENGISVADVNGDGLEDVYLCQIAGLRNRLWLRTDEGLLVEAPSSGLEIRENTCAALFLDFDADGDRDAVLTTSAGVVFFANDGQGVFTQKKSLAEVPHGFGMAASDYDQDGDLDLFVCQYYASRKNGEEALRGSFPHPYPIYDASNGGDNVLLRNDGDWKFVEATEEAGLAEKNFRYSYACLWEDFDNDGDQDLFVVNDFGPNNFYLNEGKGTFVDRSDAPGVKDGGFGMGLTAADFDLDGRYDLHISNMYSGAGNRIARQDWFHADKDEKIRETLLSLARGNTLLKNLGKASFADRSEPSGIAMGRWSWSSLAVDLNNDSREDLLVANGFVTGKDPDDL